MQSQTIARGESQTAATQSQTNNSSKTSPNIVKGTVSLNGKGIAGIVVIARPANSDGQRKPTYRGVSDQEGNYRIATIPSGTFQIGPAAPEYIPVQESRILILTERETVEDIDFDLTRGAVITGKVMSADRPLIEQQVICERIETSGNSSSKVSQTDDRGAYRVFGLRPGKYRVSVSQARTFMGQSSRFNQTFYPASTDVAKAQTLEVTEGGEVKDIDIMVEMNDESQSLYSVSGRIVDAENAQAIAAMRLRLQRADERGIQPLNSVATSDNEGQFKFDKISPGKYIVVTAALVDTNLRTENTPFAVTDKDVTELTVKAVRRASLSGVLVYEGVQKKAAPPPLSSLFVNGFVVSEGQQGRFGEAARVAADGSFHMTGLVAGIANFSLGSMFGGQAKALSISRVERDGIVQTRGLEIKGGEEITGVRLVLKYASGVIRGSIKVASGDFPLKTQFSAWLNNRTGDAAPALTPLVDARGHFLIEGLADGTYEVNANVIVTLPDGSVRGFSGKQQATIQDGNVTEITIPIDLTGNP